MSDLLEGPLARLRELTFLGLWGEFMRASFGKNQLRASSLLWVMAGGS